MITENFLFAYVGASWSSILAGAVSALAIWLFMAVIGLALGLKAVEPKAEDPTSGLGKTLGFWSLLSILTSISAGAFMAGLFAASRGVAHGFLVWALTTIVLAVYGGHAVGAAVRGLFSALRSLGSGAATMAKAATAAGKGMAEAASGALSQLQDNLQLNLDLDKISDKLNDNITSVLKDTGSQTLQPEYLKRQLREVKGDFRKLARQVALHPANASQIIADFMNSEKGRLQDLTKDLDKDTAITTLMNNRQIPREEAETMVNNAIGAYEQVVEQAQETLADLNEQIAEIKDHLKEMADVARDKADKMADSAAKGAAAVAVSIILAALLSAGFGYLGTKCAMELQPPSAHVIQHTVR